MFKRLGDALLAVEPRRLLAALGMLALGLAPVAHSQGLPQPAYATGGGAVRSQSYDRYGGEGGYSSADIPARDQAGSQIGNARLTWSGKVDASAPSVPASAPPAGWAYLPPPQATGEPARGDQAATSAPTAYAPQSIYDAPPRPLIASTTPDGTTPAGGRHYSLHREFGIAPDPIPLPPQFFGATADLTQPETTEPERRTKGRPASQAADAGAN